jgi:hypothetical protein
MYKYKSVTIKKDMFSASNNDQNIQEVLDRYSKEGYELKNIEFIMGMQFINIIMQKKID